MINMSLRKIVWEINYRFITRIKNKKLINKNKRNKYYFKIINNDFKKVNSKDPLKKIESKISSVRKSKEFKLKFEKNDSKLKDYLIIIKIVEPSLLNFYNEINISKNNAKLKEIQKYFDNYSKKFNEQNKNIFIQNFGSDMVLMTKRIVKRINVNLSLQNKYLEAGDKRLLSIIKNNNQKLAKEHFNFIYFLDMYKKQLNELAKSN